MVKSSRWNPRLRALSWNWRGKTHLPGWYEIWNTDLPCAQHGVCTSLFKTYSNLKVRITIMPLRTHPLLTFLYFLGTTVQMFSKIDAGVSAIILFQNTSRTTKRLNLENTNRAKYERQLNIDDGKSQIWSYLSHQPHLGVKMGAGKCMIRATSCIWIS